MLASRAQTTLPGLGGAKDPVQGFVYAIKLVTSPAPAETFLKEELAYASPVMCEEYTPILS